VKTAKRFKLPAMAREAVMKRFVEGVARDQGGLFPAHLEDFVADDNPVRAVDAFVEMLDLRALGSPRSIPARLAGLAIIPPFC
jgi:hypothetical protein